MKTSRFQVLLCLTLLIGACTHIEAGHVGVEVSSCSGGGVNETPIPIGYHMTGPCTSIIEFPVYQQTMILTKSAAEGSPNDDSINVTSTEGLPISVDSSLSFTIEEAKAPHIYTKFRKELENIETSYMRQAMREALQETFAKYTAQQLYSDKKEAARAEVQGLLTKKLAPDGFNITQFTINETRVPSEVLNAIKQKVAMTQQAQQAEQAVRKTEAEGRQRVANAEADAKATQLRADAEAYANQKIASSLSSALVQYRLAGKWDGQLSTYSGSGANFLFGAAK
jgi:regulator of protease activity HflC (stomatin/prohibitin superfamily)